MIRERDIRKYCAMPYTDDFDCADFAVHFVRDFFGRNVNLPGTRPRGEDAKNHLSEMSRAYGVRTETPEDGDYVLMLNIGDTIPTHGGVYLVIDHEPCVFHNVERAGGSILTPIRHLSRIGLKIEGIYKWLET